VGLLVGLILTGDAVVGSKVGGTVGTFVTGAAVVGFLVGLRVAGAVVVGSKVGGTVGTLVTGDAVVGFLVGLIVADAVVVGSKVGGAVGTFVTGAAVVGFLVGLVVTGDAVVGPFVGSLVGIFVAGAGEAIVEPLVTGEEDTGLMLGLGEVARVFAKVKEVAGEAVIGAFEVGRAVAGANVGLELGLLEGVLLGFLEGIPLGDSEKSSLISFVRWTTSTNAPRHFSSLFGSTTQVWMVSGSTFSTSSQT